MPQAKPTPTPQNHTIFDPWNSALTGHQQHPGKPHSQTAVTSWRDSRMGKLQAQFGVTTNQQQRPIFTGTTIYINGSTMPTISDHKLKHLLASHGARIAVSMSRRSVVTHVIIGRGSRCFQEKKANNNDNGTFGIGAGGGLAAGKLQREIDRVIGSGKVKFVDVEWVIESIKSSKRLPESRFMPIHLAPANQRSVVGMFKGFDSGVN